MKVTPKNHTAYLIMSEAKAEIDRLEKQNTSFRAELERLSDLVSESDRESIEAVCARASE